MRISLEGKFGNLVSNSGLFFLNYNVSLNSVVDLDTKRSDELVETRVTARNEVAAR